MNEVQGCGDLCIARKSSVIGICTDKNGNPTYMAFSKDSTCVKRNRIATVEYGPPICITFKDGTLWVLNDDMVVLNSCEIENINDAV